MNKCIILFLLTWSLLWLVLAAANTTDVYLTEPVDGVVVQSGDTLWQIAVSHYTGDPRAAVDLIRNANGMASATIHPGQWIVLP